MHDAVPRARLHLQIEDRLYSIRTCSLSISHRCIATRQLHLQIDPRGPNNNQSVIFQTLLTLKQAKAQFKAERISSVNKAQKAGERWINHAESIKSINRKEMNRPSGNYQINEIGQKKINHAESIKSMKSERNGTIMQNR